MTSGLRVGIVAGLGVSCLLTVVSVGAQPGGVTWKRYHDPQAGVSINYPAGWTVNRQGDRLLVQDPAHSSMAMIEAFQHGPDETAKHHLSEFATRETRLLQSAAIESIHAEPSRAGDEVMGTISYRTDLGSKGQARALCLVLPSGGLLFMIGAPEAQLAAQRPTLMKVLTSFAVDAPAAANHDRSTIGDVHYVAWKDPLEHGFTTQVPQSWTIGGGLYMFGPSDPRVMVMATSPDNAIAVMKGDATVPTFTVPTSMLTMTGIREGSTYSPLGTFQTLVCHYMPAQEFNRSYIQRRLNRMVSNVTIGREVDWPEEVTRLTTNQAAGIPRQVSAGQTEFTGNSVSTGAPLAGVIRCSTTLLGTTTWFAATSVCLFPNDANVATSRSVALDVEEHMRRSEREDADFAARQRDITNGAIRNNMQQLKTWSENSARDAQQQIASVGARSRADFNSRMQQKDKQTGQFIDMINGEENVRNPSTGQTSKQIWTRSHYQDSQNNVINTNSVFKPDVNWTPLQTF